MELSGYISESERKTSRVWKGIYIYCVDDDGFCCVVTLSSLIFLLDTYKIKKIVNILKKDEHN